jgi:hypothetical protein
VAGEGRRGRRRSLRAEALCVAPQEAWMLPGALRDGVSRAPAGAGFKYWVLVRSKLLHLVGN